MQIHKLWKKIADYQKDKNFLCGKSGGCNSSCCKFTISNIQPTISPLEKLLIENYCKDNNLYFQSHSISKCQFLNDDGLCQIYPVRPIDCRFHYCRDDDYNPIEDAYIIDLIEEYFNDNPVEFTNSDYLRTIRFNFD